MLNVIDDYNREAIAISPDYSIPGWKGTGAIREIISYRSKLASIRLNNGLEFRFKEMTEPSFLVLPKIGGKTTPRKPTKRF